MVSVEDWKRGGDLSWKLRPDEGSFCPVVSARPLCVFFSFACLPIAIGTNGLRQGARSVLPSSVLVLWLRLLPGGDMHVLDFGLEALIGLGLSEPGV